jgi:ACT domain-containing protein
LKVDMKLQLRDVPGSLLRALEPISVHGGNIISVLHSRGEKELVSVQLSFKIGDQSSLDLIKKDMRRQSIRISEILLEGKRYYSKKTLSFILIGHVIDRDIRDTIDRINEFGVVSDIDVVMPSPEERSSVMVNVDVDNRNVSRLDKTLYEICREKKFLLIRSLWE